ncbi:tetratricopeptide repeat protein [Thermogemmatispora tikiterensis]|uniref:Uncharacterized protein n=1 Tax=Thermogemmatispora tikiterensis TaxID=1825093 RepID=A0A328VEL2_9CHLR|nr:tetratricopeptide repeat protein [Thermogemmatispora tikiterensis]RAQ93983.1 hypothetical protein A4R35_00465 [Thermogemmatispora tikiterensis]
MEAVILRALAKQPAERFPSVEAFAAALKQAAARLQSLDLSQAISASDAVAYRHHGALYEQQGDVEQAPADFNEALRLDSAYAVAYVSRADLGVKQGSFERALADYTEAIRLDSSLAVAYTNRGLAQLLPGQV